MRRRAAPTGARRGLCTHPQGDGLGQRPPDAWQPVCGTDGHGRRGAGLYGRRASGPRAVHPLDGAGGQPARGHRPGIANAGHAHLAAGRPVRRHGADTLPGHHRDFERLAPGGSDPGGDPPRARTRLAGVDHLRHGRLVYPHAATTSGRPAGPVGKRAASAGLGRHGRRHTATPPRREAMGSGGLASACSALRPACQPNRTHEARPRRHKTPPT